MAPFRLTEPSCQLSRGEGTAQRAGALPRAGDDSHVAVAALQVFKVTGPAVPISEKIYQSVRDACGCRLLQVAAGFTWCESHEPRDCAQCNSLGRLVELLSTLSADCTGMGEVG